MSDALPDPLIGQEVDLRDFKEFPLQFERLFASDTWISCSPEEKNAALRLWCKSWHQEPAGSLPTNDRLLANLAGYGEAVAAWIKVKTAALLGWILCNDNRLYHPVVCDIAAEKWTKKARKRVELHRDRERKARKRGACPADKTKIPPDKGGASGGHGQVSVGASGGSPPGNALKGSEEKIPPIAPQGAATDILSPGAKPARPKGKRATYAEHPRFEEYWRIAPKRQGGSNRKAASDHFSKAARRGEDPQAIIDGAKRYADRCRREGTESQYFQEPRNWLREEGWKIGIVVHFPQTLSEQAKTQDSVNPSNPLLQKAREEVLNG